MVVCTGAGKPLLSVAVLPESRYWASLIERFEESEQLRLWRSRSSGCWRRVSEQAKESFRNNFTGMQRPVEVPAGLP